MAGPTPAGRVRFGAFEVDFEARTLSNAGATVKVQQQPFDVLAILLEQPGRLVAREELRDRIWRRETFVDFDHGLNIAINKLRAALHDSAEHPRFIETVPRRGYRFIAPAEPVRVEAAQNQSPIAPQSHRRFSRWPLIVRIAALALAAGIVAAIVLRARHITGSAAGRQLPNGLAQKRSINPAASEEYQRGRAAWSARNESSLREAIEHFVRTTELEPSYAPAYAGLADCYTTLGYLSNILPADGFPAARAAAERAMELDESLAEAHASLAYIHLYYDWDWGGAEREFRRAIALDPNNATVHQWYAVFLTAMMRPGEARAEIEKAHALDPLSPAITTDLGFQLYYTRQYDAAVQHLLTIVATNPKFPLAHLWLGRAYQQKHMLAEAVTEYEAVQQALPDWPVTIAAIGSAEGLAGRTSDVRQVLARLRELSSRRYVTAYGFALVYAALGDREQALRWLERGVEERTPWMVWLKLDPRWGRLADDPQFARIVKRVGLP